MTYVIKMTYVIEQIHRENKKTIYYEQTELKLL